MLRLTITILLLWSSGGAPGQVIPLDESAREATLELLVIDSFGRKLEKATVHIEELQGGKVIESFRGGARLNLKYGHYRIVAEHSGFSAAQRSVHVRTELATVIICLFVAPIENAQEPALLRGRIVSPEDNPDCRLIRLICAFCDGPTFEARSTGRGQFVFEGVKPGRYLAVLLGHERICSVTEHSLFLGSTREITVHVEKRPR